MRGDLITVTKIKMKLSVIWNNIFNEKIILKSYGQNLAYREREHKKAKKEQDLHKIPGTPGTQNRFRMHSLM